MILTRSRVHEISLIFRLAGLLLIRPLVAFLGFPQVPPLETRGLWFSLRWCNSAAYGELLMFVSVAPLESPIHSRFRVSRFKRVFPDNMKPETRNLKPAI